MKLLHDDDDDDDEMMMMMVISHAGSLHLFMDLLMPVQPEVVGESGSKHTFVQKAGSMELQ